MNEIKIRTANSSDSETVYQLARSFSTSFELDQISFNQVYPQILQNPIAKLLIATKNEKGIGYCLAYEHQKFFANGPVTWVEEIMVEENSRRLGVGKALMMEVEKWAGIRSSKMVALATRRAREFYESLGFTESAIYFRKLIN